MKLKVARIGNSRGVRLPAAFRLLSRDRPHFFSMLTNIEMPPEVPTTSVDVFATTVSGTP